MGLTAIANKAAALGMKIAGDAKVFATITVNPSFTVDPATDTSTLTGGTVYANVEVLEYQETLQHRTVEKSKGREGSEQPASSSKKLLIKGVDIDFAKLDESTLVYFSGVYWTVFDVLEIPTQAILILTLGRP